LCGEALTRTATLNHVRACAAAHDITSGPELALVQIRVTAPGLPAYWLDVEIKADAKLASLDSFLRDTWLECCGHLSAFNIGMVTYFSRGYDFGLTHPCGSLGDRRTERSMSVRVADVLHLSASGSSTSTILGRPRGCGSRSLTSEREDLGAPECGCSRGTPRRRGCARFVDNHPAPSARTALATNPTHLPARCT
jgi:hypothetical protein